MTAATLDYEQYQNYDLTVVVSDGMFNAFIVVEVQVLDSNDNSPLFNDSAYNFELDENLPNGTTVGVVEVSIYPSIVTPLVILSYLFLQISGHG